MHNTLYGALETKIMAQENSGADERIFALADGIWYEHR